MAGEADRSKEERLRPAADRRSRAGMKPLSGDRQADYCFGVYLQTMTMPAPPGMAAAPDALRGGEDIMCIIRYEPHHAAKACCFHGSDARPDTIPVHRAAPAATAVQY